MAFIRKRTGKKGTAYQVIYKSPHTGKEVAETFQRRKDAQHFIENIPKTSHVHKSASRTVKEVGEHWLEICKTYGRDGRPPVEKSTWINYERHKNIIIDMIGHEIVGQLTPARCLEFSRDLQDKHSRKYARKILSSFKAILFHAVTQQWAANNPAQKITISIDKREKQPEKIPTLSEAKAILAAAQALAETTKGHKRDVWGRYSLIFSCMAQTGLRPGEILGLPWKEVDFKERRISVSQDVDQWGNIGKPKSKAAYRTIEVSGALITSLKEWKLKSPKSNDDLVFPNWQGNPDNITNLNHRGWSPLLVTANINKDGEANKYPPYALRHIYASMEIATGANPKEIQKSMGHADIQTTFNVYGHLFPEDDESRRDRAEERNKLLTNL